MKATIGVLSFAKLGLAPELISCLGKYNIKKPTLIQSMAIPHLLENKEHALMTAQTGTGKTLAYMLPMYQTLKQKELEKEKPLSMPRSPRGILVYPNKELVNQAHEVLGMFKHDWRLRCHRGDDANTEKEALQKGIDIFMSTPDRISLHVKQKSLTFANLEYIVIDEFDTLIDAGYEKHIENYINVSHNQKARMIFIGATAPRHLESFLNLHFSFTKSNSKPYLRKIVQDSSHMNLSHLKHEFIQLEDFDKQPTLLRIMGEIHRYYQRGGVIIFCNTVASARSLEYFLTTNSITALSLHGKLHPSKRFKNMEEFRQRKVKVLVCTDLASRGLDFPFLNYVIQFDFPRTISDYVHRAGRVGRAGAEGTVYTLYRKRDYAMIKELQDSYIKNKPLNIVHSAFSLKNKEAKVVNPNFN